LIEANRDYLTELRIPSEAFAFHLDGFEKPILWAGPVWCHVCAGNVMRRYLRRQLTIQTCLARYDLVMAHAVMDLVNIPETLHGFQRLLRPGGLLYLTLNYDGVILFSAAMGDRIRRDARVPLPPQHGQSHHRRPALGIVAKRAPVNSESIVSEAPVDRGGQFGLDRSSSTTAVTREARLSFLETIVQTIQRQLQQDSAVDQHKLAQWAKHRITQITAGELIFMARNLDILCGSTAGKQTLVQDEDLGKNAG
jgi:hypothetical protein